MTKKYLVSDDKYSGKVVIVCSTDEINVDTYRPTEDELLSAMYLYRELPKQIEKKTRYTVKIFYHYELGENAYIPNGDGTTNLLQTWTTLDKNEANDLFKQALLFCR